MTNTFLLFFITAAISFLGSVQLGPTNAMVVQTTLRKSLKAGVWVAVGGSIPEFIYASLALSSATFLELNAAIFNILAWGIIPIFLGIGILTIYNEAKKKNTNKDALFTDKQPFTVGFLLGILNPQLLPFWLSILIYLKTYFSIQAISEQAAFVVGTAAGAFSILLLFAYGTHHYKARMLRFLNLVPMGYIVGGIFVFMAILQFIKQIGS